MKEVNRETAMHLYIEDFAKETRERRDFIPLLPHELNYDVVDKMRRLLEADFNLDSKGSNLKETFTI
jgi:hypothetical protein